ncbi:MAG: hypothetical protein NVSMB62_23400 [Acidobacteriaceae bacterium]
MKRCGFFEGVDSFGDLSGLAESLPETQLYVCIYRVEPGGLLKLRDSLRVAGGVGVDEPPQFVNFGGLSSGSGRSFKEGLGLGVAIEGDQGLCSGELGFGVGRSKLGRFCERGEGGGKIFAPGECGTELEVSDLVCGVSDEHGSEERNGFSAVSRFYERDSELELRLRHICGLAGVCEYGPPEHESSARSSGTFEKICKGACRRGIGGVIAELLTELALRRKSAALAAECCVRGAGD